MCHKGIMNLTQNCINLVWQQKQIIEKFRECRNHNQRTSGPVNAHLTPGPGIYFNAFIHVHVYSPRAGADNPLRTNVDVNRKPLSLCAFVASFKTISLKYDFKHILNDFIHLYSPRAETDTPWGQNFDVNRNSLSLCSFVADLKKSLWSLIFYRFYVVDFSSHVYSPRQGQTTHWGQKFYDNRKAFSLCPSVASFKMISPKSDFIHIVNDFIHVYSPGAMTENPWGQTESTYHFDHLLQVSNKSLWILILYTFLMFFHMYIAPGQGQTTPCGQNPDVNRKAL